MSKNQGITMGFNDLVRCKIDAEYITFFDPMNTDCHDPKALKNPYTITAHGAYHAKNGENFTKIPVKDIHHLEMNTKRILPWPLPKYLLEDSPHFWVSGDKSLDIFNKLTVNGILMMDKNTKLPSNHKIETILFNENYRGAVIENIQESGKLNSFKKAVEEKNDGYFHNRKEQSPNSIKNVTKDLKKLLLP
jgi:hypothetical protein